MSPYAKRIISLSALSDHEIEYGHDDPKFRELLDTLEKIHRGKSFLYGNYLDQMDTSNPQLAMIKHFCDAERKWKRIEIFIKRLAKGEQNDLGMHIESLADLAVYCIMGLQLLERITDEDRSV